MQFSEGNRHLDGSIWQNFPPAVGHPNHGPPWSGSYSPQPLALVLVLEHSILGSNPLPRGWNSWAEEWGEGRPWSGRDVSCPDLKVLGGVPRAQDTMCWSIASNFGNLGRSLVKPHTDHSKSSRLIMLELESPK